MSALDFIFDLLRIPEYAQSTPRIYNLLSFLPLLFRLGQIVLHDTGLVWGVFAKQQDPGGLCQELRQANI
jgi:thiamine transporter ThiT